MARNMKSGYERQPQDFYATPASATEWLLRKVHLPNVIWEPFCGKGDMSRVLEAHGRTVVSTDLIDRGYGVGGRDFMLEDRMPDGTTAIVTNSSYGRSLYKLVAHALELTLPVGGMVAMLVPSQWPYSDKNSLLCQHPAYDLEIKLLDRLAFFTGPDGKPLKPPTKNHCWQVWNHSRAPGPPRQLFAGKILEREQKNCEGCRTPLPPGSRIDKRHCSDACRQRARRSGSAQPRDADSTGRTESRERPWPAGGAVALSLLPETDP